ncbi:MAG: ABC transporter substrate-binding protein [Pseudomonadota bacterium]|nr:ABC transporter substrate-binding protein [Pseudomonadota bacterium]
MKRFLLKIGIFAVVVILAAFFHYRHYDLDGMKKRRHNYLLQSQNSSEVHIGVIWPLNQDYPGYLNGLKLAMKELQENQSYPHFKVHLAHEDSSKSAAWSFARDQRIVAVIGSVNSDTSKRIAPLLDNAGILFLQSGTSPFLMKRKIKLMLENSSPDFYHAENIKKIVKYLKLKKISFVYKKTVYYEGLRSLLAYQVKNEPDIKITSVYSYDGQFKAEKVYSAIETRDYDGIVFLGYKKETRDFLRYLRWCKSDKPLIGGEILDYPDFYDSIDPESMKGVYCSSYDSHFDKTPELQEFYQRYQENYNKKPDNYALLGYCAIMLLKKAVDNSPNLLPNLLHHSILYSNFSILGLKFEYTDDGILKQNLTACKKWFPGEGFVQFTPDVKSKSKLKYEYELFE